MSLNCCIYLLTGTQSVIRPKLFFSEADILLTTPNNICWYDHRKMSIDHRGLVFFLLIVKAGTPPYPNFSSEFVTILQDRYPGCGWNEVYKGAKVKYASELKQTKSSLSSTRLQRVKEDDDTLDKLATDEEFLKLPVKRKRSEDAESY